LATPLLRRRQPEELPRRRHHRRPEYKSLDIILRPVDPEDGGKPVLKEFYSTKPPLYATLLAGGVLAAEKSFGWSIARIAG